MRHGAPDSPVEPTHLRRAVLAVCLLSLFLCAFVIEPPRLTGDGKEYLAVAENLSRGEGPTLSPDQAARWGLENNRLRGADGRQDVMHFWLYPALVSPFVWAGRVAGVRPEWAFAFVNFAIVVGVSLALYRVLPIWALPVFVLSPIVWWVNKVHAEVLTYGAVALSLCQPVPWWLKAAILGVAASQNPPLLLLAVCVAISDARDRHHRWRVIAGVVLTAGLAMLHPLYYYARLGRPTPLVETLRFPTLEPFGYVLWDLNVGLIINYPPVLVALMIAVILSPRAEYRRYLAPTAGMIMLLFAFAQTGNLNHGGTPSMSRYALWLIPLAVPVFFNARATRLTSRLGLAAVGLASTVWTGLYFRPSIPEGYLAPTRLALYQWTNRPDWHNPLPEIFAERLRRQDMAHLLAATPGCEKVLVNDGVWPSHCQPFALPARCREGLCYANRTTDGYRFVVTAPRCARRSETRPVRRSEIRPL